MSGEVERRGYPASRQAGSLDPEWVMAGVDVPAGKRLYASRDLKDSAFALAMDEHYNATGSYPGGETVSVYTFATDAAQAAAAARNDIPSDDHAIIRAHLTDIYVTAVQDQAGAYVFTVTPAQIASRVNGKVAGQ